MHCANGGQRIDVGLDDGAGGGTADNQVLENGEIDHTEYVCDGDDGFSTLVRVTPEGSGAACSNGGQKIEAGLDDGEGSGSVAGDGNLQTGEVDVVTPDSKTLRLKVPAGTQSGQRFRLRGHGLPSVGRPDERGDLYASVDVEIPKTLSEEERLHYEALLRVRS